MRYYLGLDNGGTNTKAALFTPDGTQVAVESVATAALTPAPGFVERDMEDMWRDNCAVIRGVLEKSGSWYSYKGERLGQGRDNVRIYLREHPEMAQEIDQRVRGVAVDEEPEKKEEALLQENMNALLDDDFLADVDDEL
mgnify:CR=1 FL=1